MSARCVTRWVAALLALAACSSEGPGGSGAPSSTAPAPFTCTEQTVGTDVTQRCRPVCTDVGDASTARSRVAVDVGGAGVHIVGVAERPPVRLDLANLDGYAHDVLIVRGFDAMLPRDATGAVALDDLEPLIEARVDAVASNATCTITLDVPGGAYSVVDIVRPDGATVTASAATLYIHG